jgi:hypothetical protein
MHHIGQEIKKKHSSSAYFDSIELGLRNLNTTVWFGESAVLSVLGLMVPFPLPHSGCNTGCSRS